MLELLGIHWRRTAIQLALLVGIGLAFTLGVREQPASAGGGMDCPLEGECTFKKPNVMFVLDYSTSMNLEWDQLNQLSRWEVAVAAVVNVTQPGSFMSQNVHLGLMRYGHDPDPDMPGTTINAESSGLVDGQVLDVAWDDDNGEYYECNGEAIAVALAAAPAPMMGNLVGIETWTKGALDATAAEIAATRADHPDDALEPARQYINVVLTDSVWTGVDGTSELLPPSENPTITAASLFDQQGVRTYVIALADDPGAELAADTLADAGGTFEALDANTPAQIDDALAAVVQSIIDAVEQPECVGDLPRVMVMLDASSAMLNVGEPPNGVAAGPGEGRWDLARDSLAGDSSLFDFQINFGSVEDLFHLGLAGFGEPDEAKILVQYAPCTRDNFAFALDPLTSCEQPGCDDPWSGPPLSWTFKDGTEDPPGFDSPTQSHMPQCIGPGAACEGSGRSLHHGLELLAANQAEYHAAAQLPMAPYPAAAETIYANVVILGGRFDAYSTNAQVQAPLQAMASAGTTTRVIGFGVDVDDPTMIGQLQDIADWGSGGTRAHLVANSQAELEVALGSVFAEVNFESDPCCAFNDCSSSPNWTTFEPDPIPPDDQGGDGDGDGDPSGDGDGDPGDGDGDGDSGGVDTLADDGDSGGVDTLADDGDSGDATSGDSGTGDDAGVLTGRGCECSMRDARQNTDGGFGGVLIMIGMVGMSLRRRR